MLATAGYPALSIERADAVLADEVRSELATVKMADLDGGHGALRGNIVPVNIA